MTFQQRRNKSKTSASLTIKDRTNDEEDTIPLPSRQGQLNEKGDFAFDPDLVFDQLPQPFRRINKVLESIFDDAWTLIEQREYQRQVDATKFVSAQHTSSTIIQIPTSISLITGHVNGNLSFFHSTANNQAQLFCYDTLTDELINQVDIEVPLNQINVFKSDSMVRDPIYYFSVIDRHGFWKMFAYKNQKYYHLFTQHETEEETKRPICVMTQSGLGDEFLVVVWFGNNDSWLELYKLCKEQWKSEIAAHEQATLTNENPVEGSTTSRSTDGPALIRGQFSKPILFFKAKAPKLAPGSNNIQQLMKSAENSTNVGQGTVNHLYTSQVLDAKAILIRELIAPAPKIEGNERPIVIPKQDPMPLITPIIHYIPSATAGPAGIPSLAVSWPISNQLLIYKITKSDSKGKDAADTRPTMIWPFSTYISSLSYDPRREHIAIGLESGVVCILERSSGVNDLPSIQYISSIPIRSIHPLDPSKASTGNEQDEKNSGFLVLSNDGQIYRVKFRSMLSQDHHDIDRNRKFSFPQEHSKDTSKIVRMIWLDSHSSNLFLTINEMNRIYVNDAVKEKQLCEIVLPGAKLNNPQSIQVALVDQTRSLIIGVSEQTMPTFDNSSTDQENSPSLRLYRVPLEHFPSIASYYPERVSPPADETESIVETKVSKGSSHPKKTSLIIEIDKTVLAFDEKIKELFRKRQSEAYERRERLRSRWSELKGHFNPVYEQSS